VLLAVPVAARETAAWLGAEADAVVAVATPDPQLAVGEWYGDFRQTTDEEVVALLRRPSAGGEV
jgi:predicted phosphoribosyltransferase